MKRKSSTKIEVQRGMVFRHRRRRIRIVAVRGRKSGQPTVWWRIVTRQNRTRGGRASRDGFVEKLSWPGRTFLTWNGRAWTMPTAYEVVEV
jgi:hypothetical protein